MHLSNISGGRIAAFAHTVYTTLVGHRYATAFTFGGTIIYAFEALPAIAFSDPVSLSAYVALTIRADSVFRPNVLNISSTVDADIAITKPTYTICRSVFFNIPSTVGAGEAIVRMAVIAEPVIAYGIIGATFTTSSQCTRITKTVSVIP